MLDIGIPHDSTKVKIFAYSDVHSPLVHGIGKERVDGSDALGVRLPQLSEYVEGYIETHPDTPVLVMNLGDDIKYRSFYQDMYHAKEYAEATADMFAGAHRVIIPGNHDRRHLPMGEFNANLPDSVKQYGGEQDMNRSYVLRAGPLLVVHLATPFYDEITVDTSKLKPEQREFFRDSEDVRIGRYRAGQNRGSKHYTFKKDLKAVKRDIESCLDEVEGIVVITHVDPKTAKRTFEASERIEAATGVERKELKLANPKIELPEVITIKGHTMFDGVKDGNKLVRTADAIDELARLYGDKFLGHMHGHKHVSKEIERNGVPTRALPAFSSAVLQDDLPEPISEGNFLEGTFKARGKHEEFSLKLEEKSLAALEADARLPAALGREEAAEPVEARLEVA